MADGSSGRRTYLALGFLDFLAYYVPGVLLIVFAVVVGFPVSKTFLVAADIEDQYVRGAVWTVLSLIGPYVLGHLIFPFGSILSDVFRWSGLFKVVTPGCGAPRRESSSTEGTFCSQESQRFAECVLRCFDRSTPAYQDLMVTRFRTLSRFCRSMLLPSLLLFVGLAVVGAKIGQTEVEIGRAMVATGVVFAVAFVGFAKRHRDYETRWRNAICVAAWGVAVPPARTPTTVSQGHTQE
jgi:hypothetical protein